MGLTGTTFLEQVRRWFILFFLPTSSDLSEPLRHAMRVGAVSMMTGGNPGDWRARAAAIEAIRAVGAGHYAEEYLNADISQIDCTVLAA